MPRRYGWSPTTNGRRTHDAFLDEKSTYTDGTVADRRQHLVKAERMVRKRIREKRLFTFLEPPEGCGTTIPATNNLIESWNARIRDMLRHHRGLSLIRHIRAVGRWRRQHTRRPQPASWLVPTRSRTSGSRNSTNGPGRKARRVRTRFTAPPTGGAPASTGTNSTPASATPTPPNGTAPSDAHFGL